MNEADIGSLCELAGRGELDQWNCSFEQLNLKFF